jgi:hypothetical protein
MGIVPTADNTHNPLSLETFILSLIDAITVPKM